MSLLMSIRTINGPMPPVDIVTGVFLIALFAYLQAEALAAYMGMIPTRIFRLSSILTVVTCMDATVLLSIGVSLVTRELYVASVSVVVVASVRSWFCTTFFIFVCMILAVLRSSSEWF